MEPNLSQDRNSDSGSQIDGGLADDVGSIPAVFQLVEKDGQIASGWKIKLINPDTGALSVVNPNGKSKEFANTAELKSEIEKTEKYKNKLRVSREKLKLIPKSFDFISNGIVYADLRVIRINLDGELIVGTKDARLEWKPMTPDELLSTLEAVKKWREHQQAQQIKAALQAKSLNIVTPGFARNEVQSLPEAVPRSCEVVSVGDSHGNYPAFIDNLSALGVIDINEKWTGKNKKVVILGDIMADRNVEGLKIMVKIRELEIAAKSEGGEIILIAGNHDDCALSFLGGKNTAEGVDPILNFCLIHDQGRGLLEFWQKFAVPSIEPINGFDPAFIKLVENGRNVRTINKEIINNMKQSPEGQKLLEQICRFKLVEQIDDALYMHTDPTNELLDELDSRGKTVGEAVDKINAVYRQGLKHLLLGEGSMPADFDKIRKAFLNTYNRARGAFDMLRMQKLNEKGINFIFHGHSHTDAKDPAIDCMGVFIVGVDHSNGKVEEYKPGYEMDNFEVGRSIGGIDIKGKLMEKLNYFN